MVGSVVDGRELAPVAARIVRRPELAATLSLPKISSGLAEARRSVRLR